MTQRDRDYSVAAEALCTATHPACKTKPCVRCNELAGVVILKLEDLGWQDAQAIRDHVLCAMEEG